MTGALAGRTAIVTGAAAGIGRAIALRYAAEGATVVLADVAETPWHGGAPTGDVIAAAGGSALAVNCDLADVAAIEDTVATARERFGRLDIVVNNAAISAGKPLLETTDDEWARVLAVNLTGVFAMCRAAVRAMLDQPARAEVRGRIVNLTSQHGMISAPEDIAYGTSKSGVVYLTRQIAAEYAKHGIVCNAVAPGKIVTGPTERNADPQWQQYWTSRTPWPRLGRPDDVANAALFLASDEASYLTGVNLMVDGGWMAN
jgi:NAD(P)-dependent dehydrogenase (short-subunit alcohol dehydrogenase family)